MLTKKKDAVEQLQLYQQLIAGLIDKECTIKFDMHQSNGFIINGIKLQTLQGIKNKPEKRSFDGKQKSPMMFVIENNQAPLIFAFDDTSIAPLSNGIRITVALEIPLYDKEVIEIDIRLKG